MNESTNKQATKITSFNVSWTADHEQYWQGHGIAFTDYTHTATGHGETLREAFEDAIEDLAQQDIEVITNCSWCVNEGDCDKCDEISEPRMLAELTSQVKLDLYEDIKDPLDTHIITAYCERTGHHTHTLINGRMVGTSSDCAVCAGEWHYYVSIDVKVEEAQ